MKRASLPAFILSVLLVTALKSAAAEIHLAVAPQVALPTGVPKYTEEVQNFFGTTIEQLISTKLKARILQKHRDAFSPSAIASIRLEAAQVPRASILSLKATGASEAVCQNYLKLLAQEYLAEKTEQKAKAYQEAIDRVTKAIEASKENGELTKMLTDYRNQLLFALRVDTKPILELLPQE